MSDLIALDVSSDADNLDPVDTRNVLAARLTPERIASATLSGEVPAISTGGTIARAVKSAEAG